MWQMCNLSFWYALKYFGSICEYLFHNVSHKFFLYLFLTKQCFLCFWRCDILYFVNLNLTEWHWDRICLSEILCFSGTGRRVKETACSKSWYLHWWVWCCPCGNKDTHAFDKSGFFNGASLWAAQGWGIIGITFETGSDGTCKLFIRVLWRNGKFK